MLLNDDDIPTFIDAWRQAFGETLLPEQAAAEATRLLRFYLLLIADLPDSSKSHRTSSTPTHELLSLLSKIE